ncbi:MAG: O-antigen ligase family protein [Hyphomicrobium sp.]
MLDPRQLLFSGAKSQGRMDRLAGLLVLIVAVLTLVAARSTAIMLPLLAGCILAIALAEWQRIPVTTSALTLTLWTSLVYGLLSSLWSLDRGDAMEHVLSAMLMFVSARWVVLWLRHQSEDRLRLMTCCLLIGFAAGVSYVAIEAVSSYGVKRFFLNAFAFFEPDVAANAYPLDKSGHAVINTSELNRNVAAINLMLWPALFCVALFCRNSLRPFVFVIAMLMVALATFASDHETSKLTWAISPLVFFLARWRPEIAYRGLAATWIVLTLAIVPLSIVAYDLIAPDKASWLQHSARHRIIIWKNLSTQVADHPIFGVGARSTRIFNARGKLSPAAPGPVDMNAIPPHPHNVYLQTWFELGLVGALLLLASGLLMLNRITLCSPATVPYMMATFTVGMVEIAASWDLWQRWFFALLALSAVWTILAARYHRAQSAAKDKPAST